MTLRTSTLALIALFIMAGCGRPENSSRKLIENKGSDTLVNVAQAWAEEYRTVNPSLAIAVTGGGSGTGIAALINGTVDIANSSRQIKDSEIAQARANGQEPVEHVVGFDALAIFVHKDNPLDEISLGQLAEIYGEEGTFESWPQLNVQVPGCRDQEVIRVSRQNNSGTFAYFREAVLEDGDFKLGSRDMHGSKDVVDLVHATACAIGYSGLAYANDGVKMPCINNGTTCVAPSVEAALDGSYPIARPLFMYTNGQPTGAVKEYLDWIMSDVGQCIIQEKGYAPATTVNCNTPGA
jgi:phosphate transport system substrate-binding protein